jgi:signal transduction histidine kinase/HAMP domain-containing protein
VKIRLAAVSLVVLAAAAAFLLATGAAAPPLELAWGVGTAAAAAVAGAVWRRELVALSAIAVGSGVALAALGILSLLPAQSSSGGVAEEAARRFAAAERDLVERVEKLAQDGRVRAVLAGGGIAIDRQALFGAAARAMAGAPAGSGVMLVAPDGSALAWWGDAPAEPPSVSAGGGIRLDVDWGVTRFVVRAIAPVDVGAQHGLAVALRSFSVEGTELAAPSGWTLESCAPDRALPIAATAASVIDGVPIVSIRAVPAPRNDAPIRRGRKAAAACVFFLLIAIMRRGPRADRLRPASLAGDPLRLALTGVVLAAGAWAVLPPRSPAEWPGAVGGAIALILLLPVIGAAEREPAGGPLKRKGVPWIGILCAAGLALLLAFRSPEAAGGPFLEPRAARDAVALALLLAEMAIGLQRPSRSGRRGSPLIPAAMVLAISAALLLWPDLAARGAARFLAGFAFAAIVCARPLAGRSRRAFLAGLCAVAGAVLAVAAGVASARQAETHRSAGILPPNPEVPSAAAVRTADLAIGDIGRFDAARDLPASPDVVDLGELPYFFWKAQSTAIPGPLLRAYEIWDPEHGMTRFSIGVPEPGPPGVPGPAVTIGDLRVAIVRRETMLMREGRPWLRAAVEIADWPTWDPLPSRVELYRNVVLGGQPGERAGPRPVIALYSNEGRPLTEGPAFVRVSGSARIRAVTPVRTVWRRQEYVGTVRPFGDRFLLVLFPTPGAAGRALLVGMALLGLAGFSLAMALLFGAAWLAAGSGIRQPITGLRSLRQRLPLLFTLLVLVPLLGVAFFVRQTFQARLSVDTLAHARAALGAARHVFDDYLLSQTSPGRRIELLDDSLVGWMADVVGYDLSVYVDSRLLATSRRDLFVAGVLPDRLDGDTYARISFENSDLVLHRRAVGRRPFEELVAPLSAVTPVPGLTGPAVISVPLLPQQQEAQQKLAETTAAIGVFTLLLFFLSAGIGVRTALGVVEPVTELIEGTRAVSRGNFAPRIHRPADEELRELVGAFFQMSSSLQAQREALSREKERLETVLTNINAGVVAYAPAGEVLLANPAAKSLGGSDAAGRLEELFPGDEFAGLRDFLLGSNGTSAEQDFDVGIPPRHLRVVVASLPLGGAGVRMAVVEDVSDLVRSNRLSAWAEMARIIAHEIKNPLTPIRLSAEHLRAVHERGDPDFDRVLEACVGNILEQTEALRRAASEFADYARLPRFSTEPVAVGPVLEAVRRAYAGAPRVAWQSEIEPDVCVQANARLLERAVSNLVGNALEALGERGGTIRMRVSRLGRNAVFEIGDTGPGVAPDLLPRLFDPYFFVKSGGTGLGLAIVKKIVEEHGGTVSARSAPGAGFHVTFTIPLASPAEGETAS